MAESESNTDAAGVDDSTGGTSPGPAAPGSDAPTHGSQVLFSRTGLAIGTFVVLGLGLWLANQLVQGKGLTLPKPKYFPSSREMPLRSGPLPTAAADQLQPPEPLQTTVQAIEEPPGGNALVGFFRALRRTAEKRPGAVTRICHWGDSQIVADNITSTLRRKLQAQFGDAGHGFISVGRPSSYLHQDVWHWSRGWRFAGVANPLYRDRMYGLSGMHSWTPTFGPVAKFAAKDEFPVGKKVSRFEVAYLEHPQGGRFEVRVDGDLRTTLNSRYADGKREKIYQVQVPDGEHRFGIRAVGFGVVRLFGVVLERDGPGVVYDSLGLKGVQMHGLLSLDKDHFIRQLRWRRPNLVVFGFGTNESYQRKPVSEYVEKWVRLYKRVREALPTASCLVLGPVDRVWKRRTSHPRTAPLTEGMRKAAHEGGCAFWDTFAAMGGDGAAVKWRRARLLWGDLAHMNPKGGERLGGMITQALLEHYQAWLRREKYEEAKRRGARRGAAGAPMTQGAKR